MALLQLPPYGQTIAAVASETLVTVADADCVWYPAVLAQALARVFAATAIAVSVVRGAGSGACFADVAVADAATAAYAVKMAPMSV